MKYYITFGQVHVHSVNGKTFDKDCVAVINGPDAQTCDKWAFEWFKGVFHQHTDKLPPMEYFPRGLIEVNPEWQETSAGMNEQQTTLLRAALRHGIPEHSVNGLINYITSHIPVGSFLYAVLTNNLREACDCADDLNRHFLFEYISFLYNEAPSACWGSPEKVKAWLAARPEL